MPRVSSREEFIFKSKDSKHSLFGIKNLKVFSCMFPLYEKIENMSFTRFYGNETYYFIVDCLEGKYYEIDIKEMVQIQTSYITLVLDSKSTNEDKVFFYDELLSIIKYAEKKEKLKFQK